MMLGNIYAFFVNRMQLAANALDPQPVLYSVKNYSYNADD